MKHSLVTLSILAMHSTWTLAQEMQLQGQVSHEDAPLAQATVMEIDANHRVLNQTYTDNNGHFVLKVTGNKTSLRVVAPGMRRFTQKIGRTTQWEITLKEEDISPEAAKKVKNSYESTKLLVGHLNNRSVPQITWVEQINDSSYTIVVPVRTSSLVEEYPAGRKVTVTDFNGHVVASGECIETTVPEEGAPKSWDPFIYASTNNSTSNGSPFTTNDRDYFAYPRFSFTRTELEYMIDHSKELACFAVDTSRGDNYWMYYPAKTFAKELQKILNKMLK